MTLFIITKLDIKKNYVSIAGSYNTQEVALSSILKQINDRSDSNKVYIHQLEDCQSIKVYAIDKGIIYNSKELKYIYQILKVPEYRIQRVNSNNRKNNEK